MVVGVISDTHGLLRPEAIEALHGAELIVHAGDVGEARVLEHLRAIAPTIAVRGNVDTGQSGPELCRSASLAVGELQLYVLHDLSALDLEREGCGIRGGHFGAHPSRQGAPDASGVLYLNPGSAGPRRFALSSFPWRGFESRDRGFLTRSSSFPYQGLIRDLTPDIAMPWNSGQPSRATRNQSFSSGRTRVRAWVVLTTWRVCAESQIAQGQFSCWRSRTARSWIAGPKYATSPKWSSTDRQNPSKSCVAERL